MNLSPSAVFVIIGVVAMTSILLMGAVSARSRARRARLFAEVDALLAPSRDDRSSETGLETRDPWLPASDAWPSEPLEFPAPTRLEGRYRTQDEPTEYVDEIDAESNDEEEADDDMNDADMQLAGEDEGDEALDERHAPQAAHPIPIDRGTSARHGQDALTGLLDATAFEEAMSHEEARQKRYGHPATVIVFELDGLAKLVDRLGSDTGDRIETAVGDAIMRLARRADHVARLDRGRYAALLPETDEIAAINYVERIRRACDLWLESGAIAMRLAIGWASTTGDTGLSGAIRVATDRMRVELRRQAGGVGDVVPGAEVGAGDLGQITDDAVGL
ncbi:MAG TPA: GGDEF domain-containing protein [Candidatus Limnocylindrales bacterium]|nr:GGDEF domain-containing protein [Candidatus Limnocylindrales bacterium]